MGTRIVIDADVLRRCWLASLAYACGWNRVGQHYLLDAQILMTPEEPGGDGARLSE